LERPREENKGGSFGSLAWRGKFCKTMQAYGGMRRKLTQGYASLRKPMQGYARVFENIFIFGIWTNSESAAAPCLEYRSGVSSGMEAGGSPRSRRTGSRLVFFYLGPRVSL
jgi:hypothetical protein